MANENAREVTLKATLDLSGFLKDVDALNKAYASIKADAEQCAKATGAAFAGTERSSDKAFRDMGKDLDDTGLKIKAWGKDTTKAAKDAKKALDSLKDAGPGGFGAGGDPYAGAVGEMEAEELQMREQYGDQHYELSQKQQSRMDGQKEKEIASEKNFGMRMIDEMEKMGVLRGGLMWRGARAAGGTAVAIMAAGMIATKVFQGINKAIESTIETMEDLEKTSGAERTFTNLSRTAGISFDSIVSDTRKASGYTIEAYDILTRANKELRDGFGGIAENMPQLAGLARTMGDAFGVDAAGMLDNLTGAIREADAATLESEFGFRGVSAALREEAANLGVTVENLDEVRAANIALQTVLPQTEQMMRDLGATSSTATADMKETWKELLGVMRTRRDVLVAEGVLLFGGTPGGLAAANDLSEQMLLLTARLKEIGTLTADGTIEAEKFADVWERIAELGPDALGLSGGYVGIDANQARSLLQEINDIVAGVEPFTFDPLRIVTPVAFLKEFDAEMEKARDEVAKLEHEWAVAFAEFMPIEDARQSAGYLAQVYMDKMGEAIRNTGKFASDEAQATTNEVLGILAQFLDTAEAWSTETMSRIGSEMIGAAYKAYSDLVGDQTKEAERIALGLSPYLSLGDVEQFSGATEKLLADWAAVWSIDPDSLQAQYARRNILKDAQDIADAIRDANKETKASTSSMKDFASASLLANQNLGDWAAAFTIEHGGRDPMQAYARHEEPLVAAMVDKLWGEDFKKTTGRDPTDADWQAHWYEQWAPLEAWKGGPIGADTGPAGERAKAILKALGIEDLGDIYKKDWDKRHGLITEMDTEMTKIQELNTALGGLAGYINSIIPEPEPDPDKEKPPPPGYTLPAIPQLGAPPPAPYFAVPGMQHGGITRTGGLFNLHANELVMPLNRLTDMVNMRMGARGGGGLNIGALNIPVTVAGGGAGVATNVQQAVVGAIKGRGGTELMRAARRLGH